MRERKRVGTLRALLAGDGERRLRGVVVVGEKVVERLEDFGAPMLSALLLGLPGSCAEARRVEEWEA